MCLARTDDYGANSADAARLCWWTATCLLRPARPHSRLSTRHIFICSAATIHFGPRRGRRGDDGRSTKKRNDFPPPHPADIAYFNLAKRRNPVRRAEGIFGHAPG